jgi:hypothetical protein
MLGEMDVDKVAYFAVFGDPATYQKTDQTETPIVAIFDFDYDREQKTLGSGRMISSTGKRKLGISVQKTEVSSPRKDEKIIVADKTFLIEKIDLEDDISYYLIAREV